METPDETVIATSPTGAYRVVRRGVLRADAAEGERPGCYVVQLWHRYRVAWVDISQLYKTERAALARMAKGAR